MTTHLVHDLKQKIVCKLIELAKRSTNTLPRDSIRAGPNAVFRTFLEKVVFSGQLVDVDSLQRMIPTGLNQLRMTTRRY
jgi:hypothetical protein